MFIGGGSILQKSGTGWTFVNNYSGEKRNCLEGVKTYRRGREGPSWSWGYSERWL